MELAVGFDMRCFVTPCDDDGRSAGSQNTCAS